MKHLKTFNENNINEEYFGGPLKDHMNPAVDALINYLTEYRAKINSDRAVIDTADNRKVENMYNYIINDIDLDIISSSNRQGAKVRGEGETLSQRAKRSIKNF
jgi:hypothetical protein